MKNWWEKKQNWKNGKTWPRSPLIMIFRIDPLMHKNSIRSRDMLQCIYFVNLESLPKYTCHSSRELSFSKFIFIVTSKWKKVQRSDGGMDTDMGHEDTTTPLKLECKKVATWLCVYVYNTQQNWKWLECVLIIIIEWKVDLVWMFLNSHVLFK